MPLGIMAELAKQTISYHVIFYNYSKVQGYSWNQLDKRCLLFGSSMLSLTVLNDT